jgi:tetratricopeptide (TPR) repeat protein
MKVIYYNILGKEGTVKGLLPALLLIAGAILAQRPKPVFDPETKDGLLIQHIQQERDPTEKLHFMEQFAIQYPSHAAIGWVYDQIQPAYFAVKEYDQAMRIGALRLAIEPENLEAAKLSLKSAELKQDQDQVLKWADRLWQASSKLAAKGGANSAEARQAQTYAEYCIYSIAMQMTDLKARLDLLEGLERRNPSSEYSQNLSGEYYKIYRQMGEIGKAQEVAEKALQSDPNNVDMLMAVVEYHFGKDDARERVIACATRVIEVLAKKPRPDGTSDEDWDRKKSQALGIAYYMGGVSSSLVNSNTRADTMLRTALPSIKENPAMQAAAFYHLGVANYRLADKGGGPRRAMDALKFMRLCAAIKSPFQEQAIKNVESIKVEYNLQ